MTDTVAAPDRVQPTAMRRLVVALLAGGAVSLALGVYGKVHDPTREQPYTLIFSSTIQLKVWFVTAAVVLAAMQVLLALRLYGKLTVPRQLPGWLGELHRLLGTVAFAFTCPSLTSASGRSASSPPTPACWCTRSSAASSTGSSR